MLTILLSNLETRFDTQPYLRSLYRAMFTSAYYGLLRVGEVTSGDHPILAKDVHIGENKDKILFVLHMSKTHWKSDKPQIIKLTRLGPSNQSLHNQYVANREKSKTICPFSILDEFASRRIGFISKTEPFFTFSDRTPVKPVNMRNVLKTSQF